MPRSTDRLPFPYRPEAETVAQRLAALQGALDWAAAAQVAAPWVRAVRENPPPFWAMESLLKEYPISSAEGLALMRLAEALLRVPDAETAIADRHWSAVENRDAVRTYNRVPLAEVPDLAEGISAAPPPAYTKPDETPEVFQWGGVPYDEKLRAFGGTGPSVGGSGILASELGDELAARGHEVILLERDERLGGKILLEKRSRLFWIELFQ